MAVLGRVVDDMARAARAAGVTIVTGDTKVVDRGAADGMYVNTAGVGVIPEGVDISPDRATPGDVVIVSGAIGVHGIAVLSEREGLEFGTELASDSAPLHGLVADDARRPLRRARAARPDPRREWRRRCAKSRRRRTWASSSTRRSCRSRPRSAPRVRCSGSTRCSIANEGKLVAFVAPDAVDAVLAAMRGHAHGHARLRHRHGGRRASRRGGGPDALRRVPGRRPAARRAAPAHLLMPQNAAERHANIACSLVQAFFYGRRRERMVVQQPGAEG